MRNFLCPKCESENVNIEWNALNKVLNIQCIRCTAYWTEAPSDKKAASQKYDVRLKDELVSLALMEGK